MAELNIDKLNETFGITPDIEYSTVSSGEGRNDISSTEILYNNVNKANEVLDRIIYEINNGNFSARMAEVAAKVIDSITNIASAIDNKQFQLQDLQVKMEMIKIKYQEIKLKETYRATINNRINNQNIIISTREDILKALKGKAGKTNLIESNEGDNSDGL